MHHAVRFWPPQVPLHPDVAWTLLRAFAPPDANVAALDAPEQAVSSANTLGLLPRIYARVPRRVLAADLGPHFDTAARDTHGAVARGMLLERSLRIIDEVTRTLGVPYALIKGAAIVRRLGSDLGMRGACDVDILLHPQDAIRLHGELRGKGFSEKTPTHPYFHLPLLSDRSGSAVEVHTCLPELRLGPNHAEATLADLVDQGRVERAAGDARLGLLPNAETLLAHTLAHGIAQHGYAPQSYPLLRMVADVVDLAPLLAADARDRMVGLLAPAVPSGEIEAVFEMAAALVEGRGESLWTGNGDASRLLRHMVLGAFDDDYARGLKLQGALHALRGARSLRALGEYARSTFALPDADVPRIYGQQAAGKERRLKLLRPFDVAWRILRMMPEAAKIQARRLRGQG